MDDISREKLDVEKDLSGQNGLRELNYHFSKEKKEIEFMIYRLSLECGKYHQTLSDTEQEQTRLKKHIVSYFMLHLSLTINSHSVIIAILILRCNGGF